MSLPALLDRFDAALARAAAQDARGGRGTAAHPRDTNAWPRAYAMSEAIAALLDLDDADDVEAVREALAKTVESCQPAPVDAEAEAAIAASRVDVARALEPVLFAEPMKSDVGPATRAIRQRTLQQADRVLALFAAPSIDAPTVSAEQVRALRVRLADPAWQRESPAAQVEGVLHALDLRVVTP